jgi:hypothetical protein
MARQYKRDKNGRFASSNNATTTTTGRAGGFANQQFRSRVQTQRASNAASRTTGNAVSSGQRARSLARSGVRVALTSPAVRRVAVSASVVGVATAINVGIGTKRGVTRLGTRRGRMDLQKRYNQRQLNGLLARERQSPTAFGRRAIVARPGGGGSKSGRPTLRYASSSIRPPSARLRGANVLRALQGR